MPPARSFRGRPKDWLRHLSLTEEWTRRLFADAGFRRRLAPYLAGLGVDPRHGEPALRKAAAALLARDALIVARDDAPPARAACPQWLRLLEPSFTPAAGPGPLPAAKAAAVWLYLLARVLAPARRPAPAPAAAWLFDQYYDHLDDQEFLAFYRYFKTRDDVVYSVPSENCEKARLLKADGRKVLVARWSVPWSRKPAELARLLRLGLAALFDSGSPVLFKLDFLRLFRDRLRLQSLLDAQPCRRFMRVRSDMEPAHPLATALQEERGGLHVGAPSGSYYRTYVYAIIDFHEYGLLGRGFLEEMYGDAWPRSTRYPVLGPFTAELERPEPPRVGKSPIIGFFRTTFQDDFMIQPPLYDRFLEAGVRAAAALGGSIVFKEKDRSCDTVPAIQRACAAAGVAHVVVYNEPQEGAPGMRAPDLLRTCDLAVVMSITTVAWEALALGRKVLIFEDPEIEHPFETVEPRLVVRDAAALERAARWLLSMPQAEYDALVEPVIARWAKRHDGELVRDFVESLEHGR